MGTAPDSTSAEVWSQRVSGPWHAALAYSSPAGLADLLAGPVADAVKAGDQVTAVVEDEVEHRLRTELGQAAGHVAFLTPAAVHSVPAFTTALRWARTVAQANGPGARAFVVGQQLVDLPGCGTDYWARLCIGLEVSAVELPLTVICPFRDDDGGWARVRSTHQILGSGTRTRPNPDYRAPSDVVREHPVPARPDLGPPAVELPFRASDLGRLRQLTAELADRGGLDPDRAADAVLAVSELAANSIEHGPGHGRLRLWINGRFLLLAEICDGGLLHNPFPGMVRPSPEGARGRGLWLASELADVMQVWTDDSTAIRLSWH